MLFILNFVSDPESESESEPESIMSPESESEQPHHDSAPLVEERWPVYIRTGGAGVEHGGGGGGRDGGQHYCAHRSAEQ